ncbi:hypothetical protein ELH66_08105 [Rhizobium ruizarguesonis]|uniref:hypothetical protein n=1 Tax=Rhizobium ruizarguesonis TaxID=2081791 RepID=UPI00102F3642|nr:hypothetical protein [Rhizobium ruizarguesonis]TBA20962.1 hypothetical protein ELH66_08105 [Rhizobium ruizarguesonis]
MDFNHVASLLSGISSTTYKKSPAKKARKTISVLELAELRATAIQEAVAAAKGCPGNEWDFWSIMDQAIKGFNVELRSHGEPEMELVAFAAFLGLLDTDASQWEGADV